jgi:putative IMPACT (imprinted ancient) family translation regulator
MSHFVQNPSSDPSNPVTTEQPQTYVLTMNTAGLAVSRSMFQAFLEPLNSLENVNRTVNQYRKKYFSATQFPYAYILDGVSFSTDDQEPAGTAGIPILNVLRQLNLNHVILTVVREFGGVKLGKPGLRQAYTKVALDVAQQAQRFRQLQVPLTLISGPLELYPQVKNYLNNHRLLLEKATFTDCFKLVVRSTNLSIPFDGIEVTPLAPQISYQPL